MNIKLLKENEEKTKNALFCQTSSGSSNEKEMKTDRKCQRKHIQRKYLGLITKKFGKFHFITSEIKGTVMQLSHKFPIMFYNFEKLCIQLMYIN